MRLFGDAGNHCNSVQISCWESGNKRKPFIAAPKSLSFEAMLYEYKQKERQESLPCLGCAAERTESKNISLEDTGAGLFLFLLPMISVAGILFFHSLHLLVIVENVIRIHLLLFRIFPHIRKSINKGRAYFQVGKTYCSRKTGE